jgi:hypothetical protein
MSTDRHPMQPFEIKDGVVRFRANAIVNALLDKDTEANRRDLGGVVPASFGGLNWLATQDFSQADWEQFYQLIGYSLTGYHELSSVSDQSCLEATAMARTQLSDSAIGGCRDDDACDLHCGVTRR